MLLLILLWDGDIIHFTCFIKNVSVFTLTIVRYFWMPSDLFITICLGILQPHQMPSWCSLIVLASIHNSNDGANPRQGLCIENECTSLKGTVHHKMKIVSSFTHPYAFPDLGCVSQKQLWPQVLSLPIEFNGNNDHSLLTMVLRNAPLHDFLSTVEHKKKKKKSGMLRNCFCNESQRQNNTWSYWISL